MSNLQQIGVEAIFDVGKFAVGVTQYIRALDVAISKTNELASAMSRLGGGTIKPIAIDTGQLAQAAQQINAVVGGLGSVAAAAGPAASAVGQVGAAAVESNSKQEQSDVALMLMQIRNRNEKLNAAISGINQEEVAADRANNAMLRSELNARQASAAAINTLGKAREAQTKRDLRDVITSEKEKIAAAAASEKQRLAAITAAGKAAEALTKIELRNFIAAQKEKTAAVAQAAKEQAAQEREAQRRQENFGNSFRQNLVTLGVLMSGFGVANLFQQLSQGFQDTTSFIVGAVASYERLSFSVESLLARERKQIQASDTLSSRMKELSVSSSQLLPWISQLALASPFNEQDIASAFQTALAYNFLSSEAQTLVSVLTDFVAATGKTGLDIDKIALALGQMRSAGRVLGTELRQLSEAGVNVTGVLNTMGFTLADVKKGSVGANDFIKTLIQTLNKDFAGAAQRQTETLTGLASKLSDIANIGARNLFGPLLKAIQPDISTFVNSLQSLLPLAKDIGLALGYLANRLFDVQYGAERGAIAISGFSDGAKLVIKVVSSIAASIVAFLVGLALVGTVVLAISALFNPIMGVIALVGGLALAMSAAAGAIVFFWDDIQGQVNATLDGWGTNLYEYGYNLIYQFAAGMAGAIGAILDVLTNIASAISFWLSPGSPPRILPHIDDWGAATVNEWLRGWLKGDFSLLEGIADPIAGFLRSLVGLGIGETDVIPLIINMRSAITGAVDEFVQLGSVSEQTFQSIFRQLGANDPVLQAYVRSMVELEIANKKVTEAQAALNAIQERYSEILRPIDDELKAIEDERQKFIDNTRKADLQAILKDPFAPAEAKRLAALELREIALKQQRKEIEANQNTEEEAAKLRLKEAEAQRLLVQQQMEAQKAQIDLMTENNRLLQEQMKLLERLANRGGGGAAQTDPSVPFEPIDFGIPSMGPLAGAFTGLVDDLKKKIDAILDLFEPLTKKWEDFKTGATNAIDSIKGALTTIGKYIYQGDWLGLGLYMGNLLFKGLVMVTPPGVRNFLVDFGRGIATGNWTPVKEDFSIAFWRTLSQAVTAAVPFAVFVDVVVALLIRAYEAVVRGVFAASLMFIAVGNMIVSGIVMGIIGYAENMRIAISNFISGMIRDFRTSLGASSPSTEMATRVGEPIVTGLWKGISDAWPLFVTNLTTNLDTMKTQFTTWATSIKDNFVTDTQPWYDVITGKVAEATSWIAAPEQNSAAKSASHNIAQGLIDGANEKARDVRHAFVSWVEDAINKILEILGLHSPSTVFRDIGENTLEGFAVGVESKRKRISDALVGAIGDAIKDVSKMPPIPMPRFTKPKPGQHPPPMPPGVPPGVTDPPGYGQGYGPPYNTNPPINWTDWFLRYVNGRLVQAIPPIVNAIASQTDPAEYFPSNERWRHRPPVPPSYTQGAYRTHHASFLGPPSGGGGQMGPMAQFGDTYINNGIDEAVFKSKMRRAMTNSMRGLR